MNKKLFVGNLSYAVTDSGLNELFGRFGEVLSCNIATDRASGKSRGFGFVEMKNQVEAENAIAGLNGQEFGGRQISVTVSQAKPKRSLG
jgi:cold-inducible RNA-binding protein